MMVDSEFLYLQSFQGCQNAFIHGTTGLTV